MNKRLAPKVQEMHNDLSPSVEIREADVNVKETEPQRGSFSLSVALDSLKKWVRGR